jgi:hypothetical protein
LHDFNLTDLLVLGLIAVMPLVNVFSPSRWLPPPMIFALLLFAWLLKRKQFRIDGTYGALLILCAMCFLPWVYSADYISSKTLLHALAILISMTVYYAATKRGIVLLVARRDPIVLLQVMYFALLVTSAFIILEFLGVNGKMWDVSRAIPYSENREFEALAFGVIHRPRGFASEPGVMALYYDFSLFAVLPLLRRGWRWKAGYLCVIVPGYLALFSTASVASTFAAMLALTAWNFQRKVLATSGKLVLLSGLIAVAVIAGGARTKLLANEQFVSRLATFVTGGGNDVSANERRGKFKEIGEAVSAYPLGIGFGITAGFPDSGGEFHGVPLSNGQISLFGTFFVAGGIPAGLLSCVIVIIVLRKALAIPDYGPYIAAGGTAIALHQIAVTEYWLPFFWFFLALTNGLRGAAAPRPHVFEATAS